MMSVIKLVGLLSMLLVHDAPSGWQYPANCCGGTDCAPVPCDELAEDRNGGVIYWFKGTRLNFTPLQVQPSQDRQCHVCIGQIPLRPLCVFIQQGV